MSTLDTGGTASQPRPSSRRCSVSFQDTCTVIPEVELRKPRLCTRTYSVCLSKKPTPDLLYDETFIPSQPTRLTFHLPSFTRAPPLPHSVRSRRSSTGGTPGFFGYKGEDRCGLKSCLLKSAHKEYHQGIKKKDTPPPGPKATPAIVHCDLPNALASPLESAPPPKSSGILSPILQHSTSVPPASPIQVPTSPTSSHGFGITKMSSLVTRPFLRRSKTSSSALSRSPSQDSAHAPLLSRSRSTSIGTGSLGKTMPDFDGSALARSQSVNLPPASDESGHVKPKLAALVCEKVRHPGCIDEEAIAEEEDDDIVLSPIGTREDDRHVLHQAPSESHRRPSLLHSPASLLHSPTSLLHSPAPIDVPTVIPIHDCCEACTRNTLLGMKEDYTPPFSPSAIRKIQREREDKRERANVEKDVAQVASVAAQGPRKVWTGRAWEEESVSTGEEEQAKSKQTSTTTPADEGSDDDDPEQRASSVHGPTFGNEKARTMMVDEVEYVRRMRRASNASTLDEASEPPIEGASTGKKSCLFHAEKVRKTKPAEISSPDHGIWITSKPSPSRCSLHSPSSPSIQQDYLNAKSAADPADNEKTPPGSPFQQDFRRFTSRASATRTSEDHDVKLALDKEADDARQAARDVDDRHRSHSPSSKTVKPGSDSETRKWFKIPLASPLAVSGVS